MALDLATQTALANEVRRQTAQTKVAKLQGAIDAQASLASIISTMGNDANRQLQSAQAELTAILSGAGPGITSNFGIKSQITQRAEAERLVGIGALIDAIKATPTLTPAAAQTAWVNAVKAAITTPPIEDPVGVVSAIMAIAGNADWNAFLAMVIAGNKVDLMAAVS